MSKSLEELIERTKKVEDLMKNNEPSDLDEAERLVNDFESTVDKIEQNSKQNS